MGQADCVFVIEFHSILPNTHRWVLLFKGDDLIAICFPSPAYLALDQTAAVHLTRHVYRIPYTVTQGFPAEGTSQHWYGVWGKLFGDLRRRRTVIHSTCVTVGLSPP